MPLSAASVSVERDGPVVPNLYADSRPHPENGLPSTSGERCRRGISIQSLCTGTCSRIDACRIGCDATPDVCADAVSRPQGKLRGELPNSEAGNHLRGEWNARGRT